MTSKTVYIAHDGNQFDNSEDCRKHEVFEERVESFSVWLNDHPDLTFTRSSANEIARAILKDYDLIIKEQ